MRAFDHLAQRRQASTPGFISPVRSATQQGASPASSPTQPQLQRHSYSIGALQLLSEEQRQSSADSTNQLATRIQASRGRGQPLAIHAQRRLEQGMDADLSAVRVHTNKEADHLARSVNAVAFTTGPDIFFRSGAYTPETKRGIQLLAHEVTHTLQQAAGPVASSTSVDGVGISHPNDCFEQAARATATQLTTGRVLHTPSRVSVQRAFEQFPLRIQRVVGFELEVAIPVSNYVPANGDNQSPTTRPATEDWANARTLVPVTNNPQTPIYGAVADAVYAVADNKRSNANYGLPTQILEIVTRPIDTVNLANLATTIGAMQTTMNTIYAGINANGPVTRRSQIPGGGPAMVGVPFKPDPDGLLTGGARNQVTWTTYMQATAGIYAHKIGELHTAIAQGAAGGQPSYSVLQSPNLRNRATALQARLVAQEVYNALHAIDPNPDDANAVDRNAVLGFFTLIAAYLIGGSAANAAQTNDNPKNMTALFSRSYFNELRDQGLSINSSQWIKDNDSALKPLFATRTRNTLGDKTNTPLFNKTLNEPTPSVSIFLNDALGGDQDRYTAQEAKSKLGPENVGPGRPGAVLEFRKIDAPGTNPGAWAAKMTEVVQAIHDLNT